MASTKIFSCNTLPFVNLFGSSASLLLFSTLTGQLVVASLLNRNIKSRLLLRDPEKAITLFGTQDEDSLQVAIF